jgi:hypothetical protein
MAWQIATFLVLAVTHSSGASPHFHGSGELAQLSRWTANTTVDETAKFFTEFQDSLSSLSSESSNLKGLVGNFSSANPNYEDLLTAMGSDLLSSKGDNPKIAASMAKLNALIKAIQGGITEAHKNTEKLITTMTQGASLYCATSAKSRALRTTYQNLVAEHKTCRSNQAKAQVSIRTCNKVMNGLADLRNTACNAAELSETPDPKLCDASAATTDWGAWIVANQLMFDKKNKLYLKKKEECKTVSEKMRTKSCASEGKQFYMTRRTCDQTLEKVETTGCTWAAAKRHACTSYDTCFAGEAVKYAAKVKLIKTQVEDRKSQWRMTERFKCLFGAVSNAAGGQIDAAKLEKCTKTTTYPTSNLDLKYPTFPSKTICPPPTIYPGTDAYKTEVYTGLPKTVRVRGPTTCPATPPAKAGGDLLVVDSNNNRVQKCPLSGEGKCKTVATGFQKPRGLVLDSDGSYLVADTGKERVQSCKPDGGKCTSVAGGEFSGMSPAGITKTSDGYLVSDSGWKNEVVKCKKGGAGGKWECARVAGGFSGMETHALSSPSGVAIAKDGDYLVSDRRNSRVMKCPSASKVGVDIYSRRRSGARRQIKCQVITGTSYGSGKDELKSPRGLAVDKAGRILVADSKNHRIQSCEAISSGSPKCFTAVGTGSSGSGKDQLNDPWGISLLPDGFYLIADSGNNRVQKCNPGTEAKKGTCFTLAGGKGKGSSDTQLDFPMGIVFVMPKTAS